MVDIPFDLPRRPVGALLPYLGPVVRHGGRFGIFLILAPAIGPRGYGLFVLALSGVAIVSAPLVKSASQSLANAATLDDRHWSTALVTLMAAGAMISLVVSGMAAAIGSLVDDGSFGDLIRSLTVLPFLEALAVVPGAALRREGRAAALETASAAGIAAGGGIAIALAWAGAGAWSLVAQIVVQRLIECVVLWGIPGKRIGIVWSRRHFADLCRVLDWRATAAVLADVQRHALLLLVGLVLSPTAAGLCMLAVWPAEALSEGVFAAVPRGSPRAVVRYACRVALPATLASLQMAVALPPLLDLRWWGAVAPAQIALFMAIPAALLLVRTACGESPATSAKRRAFQAGGAIVITGLIAAHGLVAIAAANLGWAFMTATLWPPSLPRGSDWRGMLGVAVRPCLGAAAAGILLLLLAEPVALRLAPVPALCLLTGSAWLIYLVIRGEPAASWQFAAAGEGRRCPDRRRDAVTQIFDPTGFKGRGL
jgi:hypothetical protein